MELKVLLYFGSKSKEREKWDLVRYRSDGFGPLKSHEAKLVLLI